MQILTYFPILFIVAFVVLIVLMYKDSTKYKDIEEEAMQEE